MPRDGGSCARLRVDRDTLANTPVSLREPVRARAFRRWQWQLRVDPVLSSARAAVRKCGAQARASRKGAMRRWTAADMLAYTAA
jgi:hypothetical protein